MGESVPFVNEILEHLNSIICDLSQPQVHVFYEAIGHIIYTGQTDRANATESLIAELMTLPNSIWADIIDRAAKDVGLLEDAAMLRNLAHTLKMNVAACKSIGSAFFSQVRLFNLLTIASSHCLIEYLFSSKKY